MKTVRNVSIFLLLITSYLLLATGVRAQTGRGFSVSPPTLDFSLKPGEKTERTIKITNRSDETLYFVANVEDFIVTDKNGTPELLPPGTLPDNKFAASTWTAIIPDSLTVMPGKSATTSLYLQVPGNARPGGRYVSVAFKPLGGAGPESSGAAVSTVIGTLVYLTVEGPIEENARIIQFTAPRFSEYGPIAFTTEIKNLGDLHITPKATVEIKNILGRKAYSFALDNLNIFPATSRIYKNSWEKKLLFGRFTANLSGYYGKDNTLPLTAVIAFWVIPYKLITIVLLAIAIVLIGSFYLKRRQEPQEIVEERQKV
ncbi:MAG TPA: hypothetical protein VMW25_03430 [Clostridia bacterium]|nr:hypothetical protein [Clostridia bacterium]